MPGAKINSAVRASNAFLWSTHLALLCKHPLRQCCPIEFSVMMNSTLNVATVAKELNFKFYLILVIYHLNVNLHIWQVAAILDSVSLWY